MGWRHAEVRGLGGPSLPAESSAGAPPANVHRCSPTALHPQPPGCAILAEGQTKNVKAFPWPGGGGEACRGRCGGEYPLPREASGQGHGQKTRGERQPTAPSRHQRQGSRLAKPLPLPGWEKPTGQRLQRPTPGPRPEPREEEVGFHAQCCSDGHTLSLQLLLTGHLCQTCHLPVTWEVNRSTWLRTTHGETEAQRAKGLHSPTWEAGARNKPGSVHPRPSSSPGAAPRKVSVGFFSVAISTCPDSNFDAAQTASQTLGDIVRGQGWACPAHPAS